MNKTAEEIEAESDLVKIARINPAWIALEKKPHLRLALDKNSYKEINIGPPPKEWAIK